MKKLFRPSHAPALEECIKFEALESETEASEIGNNNHKDFAAIFSGKKTLEQIPKTRRDTCEWAIGIQKQYCEFPQGVELKFDLYDEIGDWVTDGTVDLYGRTVVAGDNIPSVIDWKPGDYLSRWAQLYTYGLTVMDAAGEDRCRVVMPFYKEKAVDWRIITYQEASERVYKLIQRLRGLRGPEFHRINSWCSMCSVRMSEPGCPAWNRHLEILKAETGDLAPLNARLSLLKSGPPEKLFQAIIAKKHWDSLWAAHKLEDTAHDICEAKGGKAFGLKLQSRGFSLVIDQKYEGNSGQENPVLSPAQPGTTEPSN